MNEEVSSAQKTCSLGDRLSLAFQSLKLTEKEHKIRGAIRAAMHSLMENERRLGRMKKVSSNPSFASGAKESADLLQIRVERFRMEVDLLLESDVSRDWKKRLTDAIHALRIPCNQENLTPEAA